MNWQTIVPLHCIQPIDGSPVVFQEGVEFTRLPEWVLNDAIAKRISAAEFDWVKAAHHAFVVQYEAASFGRS
jgi:hypothetical protein